MKILCKLRHKFKTSFSVLSDHFPSLRSIRLDTRTHIGNTSFGHIRKCERCGLEQTDHVDLFGFEKWVSIDEGKDIIKKYEQAIKDLG